MATQISPMLAVSEPAAAIEFYERALGARVMWQISEPAEVAGLSIGAAEFFLARENPPRTRAPKATGSTSVRIELFVEDPKAALERALAAGPGKVVRSASTSTRLPDHGRGRCACSRARCWIRGDTSG